MTRSNGRVSSSDVDVKEKVLPFLDRYAKLIPKLA
jgi:hypothetical protein